MALRHISLVRVELRRSILKTERIVVGAANMKIKVVGKPFRANFDEIREVMEFAAAKMIPEDISRSIEIQLTFADRMSEQEGKYGSCSSHREFFRNLFGLWPNLFRIRVDDMLRRQDMLKTIIHEMVHVKQFALGELNLNGEATWKGVEVPMGALEPWEIEAEGLEDPLYTEYMRSKA